MPALHPRVGDDARTMLGGLIGLHEAPDLAAFVGAVSGAVAEVIPFEEIEFVGTLGRPAAVTADYRLALRTPGAGRILVGVVLGRCRPFHPREVSVGTVLGLHLGAAADHVRLRALEREREAGLCGLTSREQQVLACIADGLTDRDIADALQITHRTAEKHGEHIRAKLGARSRAEAAARWAAAHAAGASR